MKLGTITFACFSLAYLFTEALSAASVASPANPYLQIVQKNPFRLLPPVELPIEIPRPTTKVTLLGLSTLPCGPQALLKLTLPANAAEVSVILGEGERTAGVEVTRIDSANRTVSVLNYGEKQEFSLDTGSFAGLTPHQQIQLQGGGNVISSQRQIIFKIQNPAP